MSFKLFALFSYTQPQAVNAQKRDVSSSDTLTLLTLLTSVLHLSLSRARSQTISRTLVVGAPFRDHRALYRRPQFVSPYPNLL